MGFPWGPIYTIECLYRDLSGGVDVTEDILRQLQPAASPKAGTAPAGATPPTLTAAPAKPRGFDFRTAGLMAAAAAFIVALGLTVYCYQQQHSFTVVLASGLDEPYQVSLNGQTHTLKPHTAEKLSLAEGEFVLADAGGGQVVGGEQRFTLAAPFFDHLGHDYVGIINPDRAAVLANSEIPYYKDGSTPPANEESVYTLYANRLSHFLARPDYVLETPAQRIDMPAGRTRAVKTSLELFTKPNPESMLPDLAARLGYDAAREHLQLQARHRADEPLLRAAVRVLKPDDLRKFLQLHLADRPVNVEWHRYYQNIMERSFAGHDLLAEYRGYLRAEPGNGALLYLLGRQIADPDEQTRTFQAALATNPPCAYAHGAIGFDALTEGRFAESAEHYEASRQAGVVSSGIEHYRRQSLLALGRADTLLPELAEARKKKPYDLELADEEIRLTYAVARDPAAATKVKTTYLAALKALNTAPDEIADAEAYLQSCVAYVTGDLATYAKLVARFESPFYQFRAAFTNGRLADAAKVTTPDDANAQLLLFLLAHRNGDQAAADQHFQAAHAAMKTGDQEHRQVAGRLDAGPPDARAVCALRMDIESKRILLAALGVRFPADRTTYFALAQKLNFNTEFPHQFLKAVLAQ